MAAIAEKSEQKLMLKSSKLQPIGDSIFLIFYALQTLSLSLELRTKC